MTRSSSTSNLVHGPRHPRRSDDASSSSLDGSLSLSILEIDTIGSNDCDDTVEVLDSDGEQDDEDEDESMEDTVSLVRRSHNTPNSVHLHNTKRRSHRRRYFRNFRMYWPLAFYIGTACLGGLLVGVLRHGQQVKNKQNNSNYEVPASETTNQQQVEEEDEELSLQCLGNKMNSRNSSLDMTSNVTDFLQWIESLPQIERCVVVVDEEHRDQRPPPCPCPNPLHGIMVPGKKFNASWQLAFERNKNITRQAVRDRKQPLDVVLVGDSITEAWLGTFLHDVRPKFRTNAKIFHELFDSETAPVQGLALGIAMDRIPQLLYRLQHGEIDGLYPKVFWLLIGTNDFGWSRCNADQIVAGNIRVVQELLTHSPTSTVVIQSILPVGNSKEIKNWDIYSEVNQRLACYAYSVSSKSSKSQQGKNVKFVNVTQLFLTPNNTVNETMLPDHVHPEGVAASIWGQEIVNQVLRIIHDQSYYAPKAAELEAPFSSPSILAGTQLTEMLN